MLLLHVCCSFFVVTLHLQISNPKLNFHRNNFQFGLCNLCSFISRHGLLRHTFKNLLLLTFISRGIGAVVYKVPELGDDQMLKVSLRSVDTEDTTPISQVVHCIALFFFKDT